MNGKKNIPEEPDIIHCRILPLYIQYEDRVMIMKLIKDSYRDGFLNGMAIRPDDDFTPKIEN